MKIKNPVFIIGCPRSGTSLLFRILSESEELWSSYKESHYIWEKHLPDKRDFCYSMYLTDLDVKEGDKEFMEKQYHLYTYNSYFFAYPSRILLFREKLKPLFAIYSHLNYLVKKIFLNDYRIIDKTPPNTFRIQYINKIFPDAKFIYLTRDGKTNISSLIDAWLSQGKQFDFKFRDFYEYNQNINIKGYNGKVWKFSNPPGWEKYLDSNKSIEEVCAFQWLSAHEYAQRSLCKNSKYIQIKYEDLLEHPAATVKKTCDFINIEYSNKINLITNNPPDVSIVSKPEKNKWLKNKDKIDNILPMIEAMQKRLGYARELVK